MALCADRLKSAGADFGAIATNTMHKVFDETQAQTSLPLVSLFDPLIAAIRQKGFTKVGLLGTHYTMSDPFYSGALARQGIEVVVPGEAQQAEVHRVIVEELVRGELKATARAEFLRIMENLRMQGAQGIVLGCTEIPFLITPEDTDMPLFDTATLHADALLNLAVADG